MDTSRGPLSTQHASLSLWHALSGWLPGCSLAGALDECLFLLQLLPACRHPIPPRNIAGPRARVVRASTTTTTMRRFFLF